MEFTTISLILEVSVSVAVLQVIQEILKQIYAILRYRANLENRANNLTLHLSVYKNYIFLVINNVSNFRTKLPYLCS